MTDEEKMTDKDIGRLIELLDKSLPSNGETILYARCLASADALRQLHDEVKALRAIVNPPEPNEYLSNAMREEK